MVAPGPSSPGRRPSKSERGFTLLELLVAVTLLAMLSVMMYGGLSFGARIWERTGQASQRQSQVQIVQGLLRREIAQVEAAVVGTRFGEGGLAFSGGPESLTFVGPMPSYLGLGGDYMMRLETEGLGPSKSLVFDWELFRPDQPGLEFTDLAEREILLQGIEGVRFEYFGTSGRSDVAEWHDRWQGEIELPRMVRLRVDFPQAGTRVWPDLVVPVMIDTTAR